MHRFQSLYSFNVLKAWRENDLCREHKCWRTNLILVLRVCRREARSERPAHQHLAMSKSFKHFSIQAFMDLVHETVFLCTFKNNWVVHFLLFLEEGYRSGRRMLTSCLLNVRTCLTYIENEYMRARKDIQRLERHHHPRRLPSKERTVGKFGKLKQGPKTPRVRTKPLTHHSQCPTSPQERQLGILYMVWSITKRTSSYH